MSALFDAVNLSGYQEGILTGFTGALIIWQLFAFAKNVKKLLELM